jgi:hypothetical protein
MRALTRGPGGGIIAGLALLLFVFRRDHERVFDPAAFAGDGDDLGVMEETIQDRPGGGHVAQEFAHSSSSRLLVMMVDRISYRPGQQQLLPNGLPVNAQLTRNPPVGPAIARQSQYRMLQVHIEFVRRAQEQPGCPMRDASLKVAGFD